MLHRRGILLVGLFLAAPIFGQQASQPIVAGETVAIESRVLNETRPLFVATPPSYDVNNDRYGVLYVLDGDWQFQHTVASAQFLGGFANQLIPPLVIVGIGNTDRMRDMTPAAEGQENPLVVQGGAEQFLEFIVEELKPWVSEHYRTSDYSVLIGHSLGGLFAAHTMVTRPEAFDGFLVVDPSLNWNAQALLQQSDRFSAGDDDLNVSLYLAVSSDEDSVLEGVHRFVGGLVAGMPAGFRSTIAELVAESHDSIPLPATYQGLQWIFSAWNVGDEAEALFSDSPGEEILDSIDDIYRHSGEQFGIARITPYLMFESLLAYLAENDRLEEAAELTLRHSDRYPLPLVPNVIAGIAQMFVEGGDEAAAAEYLSSVLDIYPGNETATKALIDLQLDPDAR